MKHPYENSRLFHASLGLDRPLTGAMPPKEWCAGELGIGNRPS